MEHSFGNFLKERRQEKKLTQKELAKLLFVSESTISKWEKDIAHPDITLLTKLSELLDVSEHELITASIDNKAREEKGLRPANSMWFWGEGKRAALEPFKEKFGVTPSEYAKSIK